MKVRIEGIMSTIQALGRMPLTAPSLKRISIAGARITLPFIRARAPRRTGALQSSIMASKERSARGKHYSNVSVDPRGRRNAVFQRRNRAGQVTAYYPASMEYGWQPGGHRAAHQTGNTRADRKAYASIPKRYPGRHYLQGGNHAAQNASTYAMEVMTIVELRKRMTQLGLGGNP